MGSLGAPRTQTHGVGLVIAPWARGVLGVCWGVCWVCGRGGAECAECGSGWGSGRGVENGAPSAQAIGSVSNPRRTCRSDRDRKGSARARQRLGRGWQDASGPVDGLTPHLTPYPRRRLGSDLQNSGLFFSSALVRKNAACLSSSPAARHRSPPPTAHRPSTAPAAQSIGWRTHRAGKRRSTQTAGVRGLRTLKLAKTKPLISPVPRLRRSWPRSEATCTGEQRWWEGASTRRVAARASGRRSVYLPCSMLSAAAVGPGID